jgi:quercetin dioxygenase-like cupin family protein
MSDDASSRPAGPLPPDDPRRSLRVVGAPDSDGLNHIAIAGGIYTILLTGEDTAGRFTLIEMRVPPGGGPPPHRHDFEETFRVLEGEVEFTFRGEKAVGQVGQTINIPANAPHSFKNTSCICSPAGQDEFFLEVADRVDTATSIPPVLSDAERTERIAKLKSLAPRYRTELLGP